VSPPIRVLHVVPDLLFGGLQRLVAQLVVRSAEVGVDAHVLVLGEVGPLAEAIEPSRLHRLPRQRPWSLLRPSELAAAIRAFGPDVVHSHSGVWLKAARGARMAGTRLVVHTDHGRLVPDPWAARLVDRLGSRLTDVVIAVSDALAERLRNGVVAHPERIRVIINGVDTDELRPGGAPDLRAELGLPAEAPVIGSIGRIEPIKGYDVMVEAFAALARRGAPAGTRLVVAGDGAQRELLEARVRELGLDTAVHFVGWRQDVGSLLATLDLFALTSRSEGTSVSLLEAMSAGVCPVVTDVGGNRAVLGPELAHRLVPSADPGAIAEGWLRALNDRGERHRDAVTARARVEGRYSLRAMEEAYAGVYRDGLRAP
jgi:glycosyltransferase involved in cell wall biosynthesis